jgi:hypothetical protein
MGLRPGLIIEPLVDICFDGLLIDRLLACVVGVVGSDLRGCGTRLVSRPSRPRFMMLAGVTGVSVGLVCGEDDTLLSTEVDEEGTKETEGSSGGGIERSTGEGVSPLTMLPPREREERSSGVALIDLEPRWALLAGVV